MSEPVVDSAFLRELRAVAELSRAKAPNEAPPPSLRETWRAAGVVSEKHPDAADKMYGEPIDPERPPASLSKVGQEALAEDLSHLDPTALVRSYPRDHKGLLLGHTVLLARYEPASPPKPKTKAPWLVARSPLRRSQPQVIALLLDVIEASGFPAQWDAARYRWDRRAASMSEVERWGIARLPLPLLDAEERAPRIAALEKSHAAAEDRAALSILLLDEGRFADALALYHIGVGPRLAEALEPVPAPVQSPTGMTHVGDHQAHTWPRDAKIAAERWRGHLRIHLHAIAPWLLAQVISAAPSRGRARAGPPGERLFTLPYGSAARRPAVFLITRGDGQLELEIEFSGTNAYLPHAKYLRPIELDLLRFGLA